MDYRITFFLRMKWNDPRLRFADMGRSSTMLTIHPELLHKIWKPDVFFSNEKRAEFHSITTENKLLRIDHEGRLSMSRIEFNYSWVLKGFSFKKHVLYF